MANLEKTLDLMDEGEAKPEFAELDLDTYHLPENYQGSKCTFNLLQRLNTIRSQRDESEDDGPKYKDAKLNYLYKTYKHILPKALQGEIIESDTEVTEDKVNPVKPIINIVVSKGNEEAKKENEKEATDEKVVHGESLPKDGAEVPKVNIEIPKDGAEVPKVGTEIPKVNIEIPKVGAEVPKVGAEVPNVDNEEPNVGTEGTKQDAKKELLDTKTNGSGRTSRRGSMDSIKSYQEDRFLSEIAKTDSERFDDFLRRMNMESPDVGRPKLRRLVYAMENRRYSMRPGFLQVVGAVKEKQKLRRQTIAFAGTIPERKNSRSDDNSVALTPADSSTSNQGKRKNKWARAASFENQVRRMLVKERFRKAVRKVITMRKITDAISREVRADSAFSHIPCEDTEESSNSWVFDGTLWFEASYFKVKKLTISTEVKNILRIPPTMRTQEQVQMVIYALQDFVAFSEYPLHLQEKIAKVAWYEKIPARRIIIRQGHYAEAFYFVLSGLAVVTILVPDPITSEPSVRTATVLRSGMTFGELGLLRRSRRTATVTTHKMMELLSIGREDFCQIYMDSKTDDLPEHVRFLSTCEFIKAWPITELLDRPDMCMLHYYKRNCLIVEDSVESKWLYIVKSGTCEVMKKLKGVKARAKPLRKLTKWDDGANLSRFILGDIDAKIDAGAQFKKIRFPPPWPRTPPTQSEISLAIQDVDNEREQEIEEINGEKEGHKERSMRKIDEGNDELDENEELGEEEEEEEDDEEDDEEEQNGSVGTDKSLRENHAGIEDTGRASDVQGLRYGGVTGVNEIVLEPKLNIGRKEFFERIEKRIQKGEELPNEFWTKSLCAASQGLCFAKRKAYEVPKTCLPKILSPAKKKSVDPPDVIIRVQMLKPGDVFGLTNLVLDEDPTSASRSNTSFSLVSHGCECVMLSKEFFLQHANQEVKKQLCLYLRPFPTDKIFQQNLQNKGDWELYKHRLVEEVVRDHARREKSSGNVQVLRKLSHT